MKQWRLAVSARESGQAVIEYALVLALVAGGLLIALLLFRSSIGGVYDRMAHRVSNSGGARTTESGAVSGEAPSDNAGCGGRRCEGRKGTK